MCERWDQLAPRKKIFNKLCQITQVYVFMHIANTKLLLYARD